MEILSAGLTDVGYKRQHNEDAFLCDEKKRLFIVADGMGGRAAGETASQAVVTVLPLLLKEKIQALDTPTPGQITFIIGNTLAELSEHLYRQSQEFPEIKGLGSTAALLFIHHEMAYVACAGDSRVYLLREKRLLQITKDQTIAAALVRTGHLSPDKAACHPLSHALEEFIGKEGQLHPGVWCKKLRPGDRWLLCSDGLTKGLTNEGLARLLSTRVSPQEVCHDLVSTAKENDGTDNITVIVVDMADSHEQPSEG
ncbi:protein serine/threonine phosphatase [Candidatus Moduliflexus flocculans]|uniref:Protein serine/threonine phosphatase n=1 Tax=Candidatus Moduliflexus flocculans TaxID=1499966 RepID=A0A0S6VRW5_9BACT|nr:protein serine/threonine phosphatase [Candidatus Moduliflexus flocculans]